MPSEDIAISVRNITKSYRLFDHPGDRIKQFLSFGLKKYHREFTAVNDVSFDIRRGETVGIIGRNGSGKSTLLQLISGILKPTSGSVQVNGRVSALLELGAGFSPEFTGRENVYFQGAIMGLTKDEMDARFADIAAFADIGEFIDQPVRTYSSGMFVRLAFAVIAHVDADILVIDEALAVGDAFFVQKCMRFLRKFMASGTVVLVTHDTGALTNLCHTVAWINKGKLEKSSNPKEAIELYLENLFEEEPRQSNTTPNVVATGKGSTQKPVKDTRISLINQSKLRNDIEVFCFSPEKRSFGKGNAEIRDVQLLSRSGSPLSWVIGGEPIQLIIQCYVKQEIVGPIVGFMVYDRLGQIIFADNTYIVYMDNPLTIPAGKTFQGIFYFDMPTMPSGNYSISAAVAEGTQNDHVQHHWIHDALAFKVHSSSVCHGLIGIPMEKIEINEI